MAGITAPSAVADESEGRGGVRRADLPYMQRALALAARGLNTTDPNPRVGCVLVRDDRIVGEGWHERAGAAHAEVNALRVAGPSAAGATAYVTLAVRRCVGCCARATRRLRGR